MGVKTKSRLLPEKPTIRPKPIDVHDEGYKGKHPEDLNYPHEQRISSDNYPDIGTVNIKAFSKSRLKELEKMSRLYLFPILSTYGLKLKTLAEKRSGGQKSGKRTLGVCFARVDDAGEAHAIILDQPKSDNTRVLYTLVHEVAHILEPNHDRGFKEEFGRMLSWAINNDDYINHRDDLVAYAKGDSYATPVAPTGNWDDYPTETSYEISTDDGLMGRMGSERKTRRILVQSTSTHRLDMNLETMAQDLSLTREHFASTPDDYVVGGIKMPHEEHTHRTDNRRSKFKTFLSQIHDEFNAEIDCYDWSMDEACQPVFVESSKINSIASLAMKGGWILEWGDGDYKEAAQTKIWLYDPLVNELIPKDYNPYTLRNPKMIAHKSGLPHKDNTRGEEQPNSLTDVKLKTLGQK